LESQLYHPITSEGIGLDYPLEISGKNPKTSNQIIKMKKLATLFAMVGVGLGTALAQGTIDFHNPNTFPLQVRDAAGNVTTLGAAGSPLGPGSVRVGVFIGTGATSIDTMTMVGMTTNSSSTLPLFVGTFNGGNPYTIAGHPQNEIVNYAFAAWSISTGALTWQAAKTATTGYVGNSGIGLNYTLAGGATTPSLTFGNGAGQVQGFTLNPVPEPSTIALGLLGAAALFLRRRK
jgi:hypothetical protein